MLLILILHYYAGVACPNPRTFQNGKILAPGPSTKPYFYSGEGLTFFCNLGYYIGDAASYVLEERLTCQDDGTWDAEFPACVG